MTFENSSDAKSVEEIELSHDWIVTSREAYGREPIGVLVTLECKRCSIEKGILMIQKKKYPVGEPNGNR